MQISLESAWNIIIHLKKELHIISPVAQLPQIVESKAGTSNSSLTRFQVDLHPLDGAFLEGQSAAGGRSMRAIALDAISLYDTLVKGIKPDGSVDIVVVNGKGEHFPRTLYLRGF